MTCDVIKLNLLMFREGFELAVQCIELDVAAQGNTPLEAMESFECVFGSLFKLKPESVLKSIEDGSRRWIPYPYLVDPGRLSLPLKYDLALVLDDTTRPGHTIRFEFATRVT